MVKNLFGHTKYYDDKRHGLVGTSRTKRNAEARAERYRNNGWNARIEQKDTGTPFRYGVYARRK